MYIRLIRLLEIIFVKIVKTARQTALFFSPSTINDDSAARAFFLDGEKNFGSLHDGYAAIDG